jgi:hypothetical protein
VNLILKRGKFSRSSGAWKEEDYDVLENGGVVGRIFFLDAVGPQGRPWMWETATSAAQPTDTRSRARRRWGV